MSNETEAGTLPVFTMEGTRATIRLNRPRHLNKLKPEDLEALTAMVSRVEADRRVRVLVLTGTGRAFSAGFDLGAIAARTAARGREPPGAATEGSAFETIANRLEDLPVPTICRLNGGVYGGSTDLALACDFRIAVDSCEMIMPAARLGLHYYKSGMVRYVSRLGVAAAKKLFLTAEKIDAAEMLRIGYLDEAVPAERLDERVDRLAEMLAANAPMAIAGMKRTINEIARGKLDEAAAGERHRQSMHGDEIKEGAAAFADKRKPNFGP